MKRLLIVAVAALTLSACSKGGDLNHGGAVQVPGAGTLSKQVPANLPDYVKIYPGAVVTAVMDNGASGGVIAFDVTDPAETVMDFYKKAATDAKLAQTMDSWALAANTPHEGAHVVMFSQAGTKRNLSTTVEVKDGKTHVGLIYAGAQ